MDADLWSTSADSRGHNISALYLSGVHLHCHALHYFPTMDGYIKMCGFQYFTLHPVQHLASAITSPSPRIFNFKFAPRKKSFRTCVPSVHKCQRFSLIGYVTNYWLSLWIHCARFQISWQHMGKGDSWQHRWHTDRQWRAVSEDIRIIRYWLLLHDTASIGRVTIPSNRADRPTLNLCHTDQHTPPLSPTVAKAY